jgi:hypothetical protein
MKIFIRSFFLIVISCILISTGADSSFAKGGKSKGISKQEMTQIITDVDELIKKVYSRALFSPSDNSKLIEIKMKLDMAMLAGVNPEFAPLYYKTGIIYRARELKDESIECFQTILENFGDTALAPKARKELQKMGITVKDTETEE